MMMANTCIRKRRGWCKDRKVVEAAAFSQFWKEGSDLTAKSYQYTNCVQSRTSVPPKKHVLSSEDHPKRRAKPKGCACFVNVSEIEIEGQRAYSCYHITLMEGQILKYCHLDWPVGRRG
ncbi:hypothetical protein B0H14DRAFT_2570754 [Mycena olivaceomarginata]|nr:hypothetical protein B0H14DRAFT_2570754 [Mycena olivaceomarginata]